MRVHPSPPQGFTPHAGGQATYKIKCGVISWAVVRAIHGGYTLLAFATRNGEDLQRATSVNSPLPPSPPPSPPLPPSLLPLSLSLCTFRFLKISFCVGMCVQVGPEIRSFRCHSMLASQLFFNEIAVVFFNQPTAVLSPETRCPSRPRRHRSIVVLVANKKNM